VNVLAMLATYAYESPVPGKIKQAVVKITSYFFGTY